MDRVRFRINYWDDDELGEGQVEHFALESRDICAEDAIAISNSDAVTELGNIRLLLVEISKKLDVLIERSGT